MVRTKHTGIFKKGNRYVVIWRHRGAQKKKSFVTLPEARQFKAQMQSGDVSTAPPTREWLDDYARDWLASYQGDPRHGGIKPRTKDGYLRMLEVHVFPYFERKRLGDVRPDDLERFISHLIEGGLSPGSVRKVIAPLKRMYRVAHARGHVRADPFTDDVVINRKAGKGQKDVKPLSRDDLRKFLGACEPEHRLLFELLAKTGLRISEALGLEWRDVNVAKRVLRIERQWVRGEVDTLKSAYATRRIPLTPGLAEQLAVLGDGKEQTAPVFAGKTGGHLIERNVRRRWLTPACKSAGLEPFGFHVLRHSFASLAIAEGKDLLKLSRWMGHHSPAFTLAQYGNLLEDHLGDADFLDDMLVEEGSGGEASAPQPTATTTPAVAV